MCLKSTEGKILFEGRFSSVKKGVEMAVEANENLSKIDLRQANLAGAQMDDALMEGACFWGANLNGANMSDGYFQNADFRTANFLDTCLAGAICGGSDFSGAYFSRTIVRNADLSETRFSCPSLFTLDLVDVKHMEEAVYCHRGEVDCALSHAPLIIRGLTKPLIFMDDKTLVGQDLREIALREHILNTILYPIEEQKVFVL